MEGYFGVFEGMKLKGDYKMSIKKVKTASGNTMFEKPMRKQPVYADRFKYKEKLKVGSVLHLGDIPYEYLGNGLVGSNTKRRSNENNTETI